jgi:hypothetical protein
MTQGRNLNLCEPTLRVTPHVFFAFFLLPHRARIKKGVLGVPGQYARPDDNDETNLAKALPPIRTWPA